MKSRYALSVVAVIIGAALFLADKALGGGPFSPSSNARLAAAPTLSSAVSSPMATVSAPVTLTVTATPTRTPLEPTASSTSTAKPANSPTSVLMPTSTPRPPDPTEIALQTARVKAAGQIAGASAEELWSDLAGFSGKSNQEREHYVSDFLFPKSGLTEISKQSVPFGGNWGPEYGNWDGLSNVVAVRRGTLPAPNKKVIILGAHFDKVTYPGRSRSAGRSDGIFDNASGVNAIAKIVESLQSPLNDIEVVAFATEEPNPYFWGSRIYFGKLPDDRDVLFFANFDCLGVNNLSLIRGSAEPFLADLARKVAEEQNFPLDWRPAGPETASDHLVAQYFGYRVLSFTTDGWDYHSTHVPEDNLSEVDKEAYYQQYLLSLKIIAYLDAYLADASFHS